jgi:hypothetical protein
MPRQVERHVAWRPSEVSTFLNVESEAFGELLEAFKVLKTCLLKKGIEEGDLGSAVRKLRNPARMMSVVDGVLEETESGLYDAALHTGEGRVVLQGARRTDLPSEDPQVVSPVAAPSKSPSVPGTPADVLHALKASGVEASTPLLCAAELMRFSQDQRAELLPLLWEFILRHRDSNNPSRLVGVSAAIRKYIAIMPMDRLGDLAVLIEAGHRSQASIEAEIEVAKMVYRNFEVHPPARDVSHPELANRLWEIAQLYVNPRLLTRGKHSAAAAMSIQALIAMRSEFASNAWELTKRDTHRWFAELVSDALGHLSEEWRAKNQEAADWLDALRQEQHAPA